MIKRLQHIAVGSDVGILSKGRGSRAGSQGRLRRRNAAYGHPADRADSLHYRSTGRFEVCSLSVKINPRQWILKLVPDSVAARAAVGGSPVN